jgi:membrane-associated phospholipid phosphatase
LSAANEIAEGVTPNMSWHRQFKTNVRKTIVTLLRAPRRPVALVDRRSFVIGAMLAVPATIASMIVLDPWSLPRVSFLPVKFVEFFDYVTDYGLSHRFLWPLGLAILALAALDSPAALRFCRLVLAAWGARLGFLFLAISVPGLFVSIVKRLIGRARPFAGEGIWSYQFFGWRVDHASLPSGHATTAFAVLAAVGALFPEARVPLWIYAVLIALSRVALGAHHPSDVVAGAIVGAAGALLVRNWFAARGLVFKVDRDGDIRPMPGPGVRRIASALGHCLHSLWKTVA